MDNTWNFDNYDWAPMTDEQLQALDNMHIPNLCPEEMAEILGDFQSFREEFPLMDASTLSFDAKNVHAAPSELPVCAGPPILESTPIPSAPLDWSFNSLVSPDSDVLETQGTATGQRPREAKRKHSEVINDVDTGRSITGRGALQSTDTANLPSKKKQKPVAKAKPASNAKPRSKPATSKAITKRSKPVQPRNSEDSDVSDTPIANYISEDESEDEVSKPKQWSLQETKQLVSALIGVDGRYAGVYSTNPTRAYKKVSRNIFNSLRNPTSVKGRFLRTLKMFKAINRFENWTGNGSGDPDISKRLRKAKDANSVDGIKDLTVDIIDKFKRDGLYVLFYQRCGLDPTIVRRQEYASGLLSDVDPADFIQSEDEDNNNGYGTKSQAQLRKTTPTTPQPPASSHVKKHYTPGVPISHHPGRPKAPTTPVMDPEMSGFLKNSTAFLQTSAEDSKKRTEIMEARTKLETQKSRLSILQSVLSNDALPADSKEIAHTALNKLLQQFGDDI